MSADGEPLDALFARALELPRGEREALLVELRAERPEDARELTSLLDAHARADGFLEAAPVQATPAPARIGGYRLLGLLGEGGMGVVHLAEQEHPRRTVALKLLHPGLATPRQRARFEREAALLGRLSHRGIARIYEAGVDETGPTPRPWFAMERVDGAPLDRWVAEQQPSPRARVALLAELCEAVEHAHAQGVVHRDLKPANVLVGGPADAPEVKVLDFGVARAVGAELDPGSLHTAAGQLVGTLPYMSPEQAAGDHDAVGPRSDVYSLGLIAHQLLAGALPYELDGLTLIDAVSVIREREPGPLSGLPSDLRTIVRKALAKEPARRYASAGELGRDLRLWLDDRPIHARPPTASYHLAKLARRHKALVAGAAATLLALAGGLAVALRQNALLRAERDRVAAEKRNADAVAGWFETLLAQASPWHGARDLPLRVVLEEGVRELPPEVLGAPAIEARVRGALALGFETLGELERADAELERALARAREARGASPADALELEGRLGRVRMLRGRLDEAEPLLERAHAELAASEGPGSLRALAASDNLALCLQARGELDAAEVRMRANLEGYEQLGESARPAALTAASNLAGLLVQTDRAEEAVALLEPALAEGRALEGPRHPNTLMKGNHLANALMGLEHADEALPLFEELHDAAREVLGAEHPDTLSCRLNLAMCLAALGRADEALPHLRAVLAARREQLGDAHPATLTALHDLASACRRTGLREEAAGHFAAALEGLEQLPGAPPDRVAGSRLSLGLTQLELGRYDEAAATLERAVEENADVHGPDDWRTASTRATLAIALRELGLTDEAARELELALPALEAGLGPDHPRTLDAKRALAELRDRR